MLVHVQTGKAQALLAIFIKSTVGGEHQTLDPKIQILVHVQKGKAQDLLASTPDLQGQLAGLFPRKQLPVKVNQTSAEAAEHAGQVWHAFAAVLLVCKGQFADNCTLCGHGAIRLHRWQLHVDTGITYTCEIGGVRSCISVLRLA